MAGNRLGKFKCPRCGGSEKIHSDARGQELTYECLNKDCNHYGRIRRAADAGSSLELRRRRYDRLRGVSEA